MLVFLRDSVAERLKRAGAYSVQRADIATRTAKNSVQYVTVDETYGRDGPFNPSKSQDWLWRSASSSGTSGMPLVFRQPMSALQREQAFLDFAWEKSGFRRSAKLAIMRGMKLPHPTHRVANRLLVSMAGWSDNEIAVKHEALREFSPEIIACYPSILERFLLACARLGLDPLPKVSLVLAGSEACAPQQFDLFRERLGAKTVSWYGQSEQVALAFLQHDDVHEFFPGYSDLAFLRRGEMYEICGRSLLNPTFAGDKFYRTGDLCEEPFIRTSKFFGAEVVATTKLLGRSSELITSSSGVDIPLNNIIFGLHGADWSGVDRYCVVHTQPGEFLFLYSPRDDEASKRLIKALSSRVPEGFFFEARVCPELAQLEPAKWRYLVRDLHKLPPACTPQS